MAAITGDHLTQVTINTGSTVYTYIYIYIIKQLQHYYCAGPQAANEETTNSPNATPAFTSEEVKLYRRRKEEGYDIPDPRYLLWLQIEPQNLQSPSGQQSSCQDGNCGHPKARQWIECDYCQRWYHCLCAKVAHKKAHDTVYACPLCKA